MRFCCWRSSYASAASVVYATIARLFGGADAPASKDVLEDIEARDADTLTDAEGHFSSATFEAVPGLTPNEYILLYVQANDGRV